MGFKHHTIAKRGHLATNEVVVSVMYALVFACSLSNTQKKKINTSLSPNSLSHTHFWRANNRPIYFAFPSSLSYLHQLEFSTNIGKKNQICKNIQMVSSNGVSS